jgi:homocysteine S-methyltransferase
MKPGPSPADALLIDGATGTELERRGVNIALPLWSARALIDAPQVVQEVHEDYLRAGAGAVTTCTFRTHERSLARAGLGARARELTGLAVELAQAAVRAVRPGALVLGSVAPLEECYDPVQAPARDVCRREHERMMRHLLDAGVDLLLIETMGTLREAEAAAGAARALAPGRWILSFCARSSGPPGRALSGEEITGLLGTLGGARAVGVNCVAAPAVLAQVRLLRASLPAHVAVAAYANIGRADEQGNWVCTEAADPARYARAAREWIDAGATIVGGCCGTRPETIRAVAQELGRGSD